MSAYVLVKFVHVLMAITAVGSNLTYGIWLGRASREPQYLEHVLRGIAVLDSRVANPAYVTLFVTGALLVLLGDISWRTPWLLVAILIYAVVALTGVLRYAPLLRAQVEALRRSGSGSEAYRTLEARARTTGAAVTVLALAIVYLMVTKPALW